MTTTITQTAVTNVCAEPDDCALIIERDGHVAILLATAEVPWGVRSVYPQALVLELRAEHGTAGAAKVLTRYTRR
jgi:hypothetical protein